MFTNAPFVLPPFLRYSELHRELLLRDPCREGTKCGRHESAYDNEGGQGRPGSADWRLIMAAVICKEHGRQLAVLVCPHVGERFDRKDSSEEIVPVHGTCLDATPGLLFWCCSGCSVKYGLGLQEKVLDFFDFPEEFGDTLCPICHLCFEAWNGKGSGDS